MEATSVATTELIVVPWLEARGWTCFRVKSSIDLAEHFVCSPTDTLVGLGDLHTLSSALIVQMRNENERQRQRFVSDLKAAEIDLLTLAGDMHSQLGDTIEKVKTNYPDLPKCVEDVWIAFDRMINAREKNEAP